MIDVIIWKRLMHVAHSKRFLAMEGEE